MPHYKTLLDPGIFIGPQDFPTDKTVQIARVVRETMAKREGDRSDVVESAPMIYFAAGGKELARKFKAPKSVLYGLSLTYGTDTDGWIGKDVTLFATKCLSFGEVEECVRIRFQPAIDRKICAWMKKRKSNARSYMLDGAA